MQDSSVSQQTSQVKPCYTHAPQLSDEEFGFLYYAAHTFAVPTTAYCHVSLLVSRVPGRRFNRCLRSCGSPNLEPALTQLQNVAVFWAALVCLPPASWPSQDDCVPWRGAECFPLSRRGKGVSVFSALWVWLTCCTCYCGVTALVI